MAYIGYNINQIVNVGKIDSAFGKANTANTTAVAAFEQANTAYSSAVLKTGNTMTGNLVMSGANIAFDTATNSGIYWSGTSFIHSPAANTLVFGTSSAEDMRITSNGNVGIGTSSPSSKLHVISSADEIARFEATTNPYISLYRNGVRMVYLYAPGGAYTELASEGRDLKLTATSANVITFATNASERMRIDSNGRVGIGTAAPTANLHVTGNVTALAIDISGANVYSYMTGLPQNSQSAAYGLLASDAGKHILHPSADTTARTFTIPANSSVSYPIGTAITFINQHAAGNLTIAITTDTMRLAGGSSTGNRTLVANGVATAIKITFTEWIISGVGLS